MRKFPVSGMRPALLSAEGANRHRLSLSLSLSMYLSLSLFISLSLSLAISLSLSLSLSLSISRYLSLPLYLSPNIPLLRPSRYIVARCRSNASGLHLARANSYIIAAM